MKTFLSTLVLAAWLLSLAMFSGCQQSSASGNNAGGAKAVKLLNVSYDPTRELYAEYNEAFKKHWKETKGQDVTIAALALMVPRALKAAEILKEQHGIDATVIDVRSLVPLDTQTILRETAKTGRLVTVEENPRLCGWGAEIASIVAEELFWDLDGPIVRVTTPHVPLAAANNLEDAQLPTPERIVESVRKLVD